jgi:nitrite reductase (cytochrome c-552)
MAGAILAAGAFIGVLAGIGSYTFLCAKGYSAAALDAARRHHRRAQFLLDFIEAENSMGFHADQEAVRVLALSIDETRRGQASLRPGAAGATATTAPASRPK